MTQAILKVSCALPANERHPTETKRVQIGHAPVDCCNFDDAVESIVQYALAAHPPAYVVTPNAQHVVLLETNIYLREIYRKALLSVADGASLVWASRLFHPKLPERVAGVDLLEALCARAARLGLRVFFMGGRTGAAEFAARRLQEAYPQLQIAGTACPPHGFEHDPEAVGILNAEIRASLPDLLFVGLGAPKQEYWMFENCNTIGVPVSMGIGGSFDFIAGMTRRAPRWMQSWGIEWLHRLWCEPRRLWKRYLIGNFRFIWVVIRQKVESIVRGNA